MLNTRTIFIQKVIYSQLKYQLRWNYNYFKRNNKEYHCLKRILIRIWTTHNQKMSYKRFPRKLAIASSSAIKKLYAKIYNKHSVFKNISQNLRISFYLLKIKLSLSRKKISKIFLKRWSRTLLTMTHVCSTQISDCF